MSDIFISYASADRERAKLVSVTLDRRGWSVWWDRTIPPGKEYDEVIEKALDSAKCVVVLWSNVSVASSWVKTEAAEAMRRKILVPALIDDAKIPLEFRRLQAADLSQWHGEPSHPELQKFFDSIEVKIHAVGETAGGGKPAAPPPVLPLPPIQPAGWTRAVWPAIALIGALAGVAAGLMLSRSQQADKPSPPVPVTGTAAVTQTPPPQPPPPAPKVNPDVVNPPAPVSRPPAPKPNIVKPPEPTAPAPVSAPPVSRPAPPEAPAPRPPVPEPPAPAPEAAPPPPVAAASHKLPPQEFPEILAVVNNDGEIEELDATLVFGETSLEVRDEDSKVLRTLPYSSIGKATYSRTQRRIMFVRTIRHQLTLGTGRDELVLRLPDATYQSILYQIEKRAGITVARRGE
jgi:TIR domain-containing protein